MKARIVESIKSTIKNGVKKLIVEVLKDDAQEHTVFTLPGFETSPVKGEKCLLIPTEIIGKAAVFGVTLKTKIPDGEVKINGRDSIGNIRGSIHLKNDGTFEIGIINFHGVLTALFKPYYDSHIHVLDVPNSISLIPTIPMPESVISSTVKVSS